MVLAEAVDLLSEGVDLKLGLVELLLFILELKASSLIRNWLAFRLAKWLTSLAFSCSDKRCLSASFSSICLASEISTTRWLYFSSSISVRAALRLCLVCSFIATEVGWTLLFCLWPSVWPKVALASLSWEDDGLKGSA